MFNALRHLRISKVTCRGANKARFAILVSISCLCCIAYYLGIDYDHLLSCYYVYVKRQRLNSSRYVSFDASVADGRRLGNQIFDLAAVLYISVLTGKTPVLNNRTHLLLEDVFELSLERVGDVCPCYKIVEYKHLSFDGDLEDFVVSSRKFDYYSISVSGFRQSWKYTRSIDRHLRQQLTFKREIRQFAENFIESNIPPDWKTVGFVRVGVHARRGDNTSPLAMKFGYTVANETYFRKAMRHFTDTYDKVQFFVASDDYNWTKEYIASEKSSSSSSVNVTHCLNHTAGQDMALLSMCDHVIMSTGTFGWWAAWLAKGTTIYYRDWPRKDSPLFGHFNKDDFFPPSWIPMGD